MVYRTSTDGLNWISPETVRSARHGNYFSIWFDGTYLHYAYTSSVTNTPLYYRRGTPNSDGSITWSAIQTAVAGTPDIRYSYPFVSVDSAGHAWIGCGYVDVTTPWIYTPYVTKSSTTTGIWATDAGFPHSFPSMSAFGLISIIPLTANNMLAIYVYDTNKKVRACLWNGTTWGIEVSTSNKIQDLLYFSAVAEGNDVHLVFKNSNDDLIYSKYDYATNSFIAEKNLLAGMASYSAPVLSIDEDNNLYVFWGAYPVLHTIYYMIYTAENDKWGPTVKWKREEYLFPDSLTCFYKQYSNYIGLAYTTKPYPGPYDIKFNYITLPPAPEPTPKPEVKSNTLISSGSRHTTPEEGSVGTSQSFKGTRISRHITWVPVVITRA